MERSTLAATLSSASWSYMSASLGWIDAGGRSGIGRVKRQRMYLDVEPGIQRERADCRVQLGRVACLPQPPVSPAPRRAPQPPDRPGLGQLPRSLAFGGRHARELIGAGLRRPVRLDSNEEFHSPPPRVSSPPSRPATLGADHRAVDGVGAAELLADFTRALASPTAS